MKPLSLLSLFPFPFRFPFSLSPFSPTQPTPRSSSTNTPFLCNSPASLSEITQTPQCATPPIPEDNTEQDADTHEGTDALLRGMIYSESDPFEVTTIGGSLKRPLDDLENGSQGSRSDELEDELAELHRREQKEKSRKNAATRRKMPRLHSPKPSTVKTTENGSVPPETSKFNGIYQSEDGQQENSADEQTVLGRSALSAPTSPLIDKEQETLASNDASEKKT